MAPSRRHIKRTTAVTKPPTIQSTASRLPKKWLAVSATLTLLVALLLVWKFAPANSAPIAPSSASLSPASLNGETADTSLLTPPLPLITPADAPVPDAVRDNLPASVPAQMGEEGAKMRRVVDKKIENGKVILVLKDEDTGRLSIMKQPLGTRVGTLAQDRKEQVASSAPVVKPLDPATDDLPTTGIENIKAGMTVPTRNPITGKTEFKKVTHTFKRTAYEIVRLELVDQQTGNAVDKLQGTPEHPFFVEGGGMVGMGQLTVGAHVISRTGLPLIVKSVTREPHPEGIPVYNFEVEGDHTYFVGKANGGIWVHNDCIPGLSSWRQALKSVTAGDVRVATRADAEEIARAFAGYKNTTGEVRREAELLSRLNQNPGYYHWADNVVVEDGIARVAGHAAEDVHGLYRHLQIHTFGGKTVRVFYGSPVR